MEDLGDLPSSYLRPFYPSVSNGRKHLLHACMPALPAFTTFPLPFACLPFCCCCLACLRTDAACWLACSSCAFLPCLLKHLSSLSVYLSPIVSSPLSLLSFLYFLPLSIISRHSTSHTHTCTPGSLGGERGAFLCMAGGMTEHSFYSYTIYNMGIFVVVLFLPYQEEKNITLLLSLLSYLLSSLHLFMAFPNA